MPRFMLDTDICSYIMKRSHPPVLKHLRAVPVSDVCMSVVTKAELLHGVAVSPRANQDAAALAALLPYVEALALTDQAASHYAKIRADLKKRGAMIGANDLLIAAHAQGAWNHARDQQHRGVPTRPRPRDRELDDAAASEAVIRAFGQWLLDGHEVSDVSKLVERVTATSQPCDLLRLRAYC